jgi:peptide/nickel transport system substrate-binding protein
MTPTRRGLLRGTAATALAFPRLAGAATATRLVGALEETPPTMNPAISAVISTHASGTPVYGALTHILPDGTVRNELAEHWEMAKDGLTYTFHLRQNVSWHDDAPFTSADVKFSIENANGKLHQAGRGAFRMVDRIDTPDAQTVIFRMKAPSAAFIYGTDSYCGDILPRHLWEGSDILKNPLNLKPVGTGPYKMVEFRSGEFIRYQRNDKYFLPGLPHIDEVVLRIIPDAAGRLAAFENGELDMLYHNALPWPQVPRIEKIPGVGIKLTNLRGAAYLGIINTRRAPFDDVRVRQALAHAIDRNFLRKTVAGAFGLDMRGPVPPVNALYNRNLPDYAFDAGRANMMLDQAGHPRGADGMRFNFDFLYPNYDMNMATAGDIISRNLRDVGIRTTLQPLDRLALNQKGYVAGQFDMIAETYGLGPDPDMGVERLYNGGNIHTPGIPFTNTSGYANPEVDALFDRQRVQTDQAARKAIYDRIQELIWRDLPVLPLFSHTPPNAFWASRIQGVFNGAYGNQDSFAEARLIEPAVPPAGERSRPYALTAGGAVLAAGIVGLGLRAHRRRAGREDPQVR